MMKLMEMHEHKRRFGGLLKSKKRVFVSLNNHYLIIDRNGAKKNQKVTPCSRQECGNQMKVVNLDGAIIDDFVPGNENGICILYRTEKDKVASLLLSCSKKRDFVNQLRKAAKVTDFVSLKEFTPIYTLGKGHFGKVNLVIHDGTDTVLALKEIKEHQLSKAQKKRRNLDIRIEKQLAEKDLLVSLGNDPFVARLAYTFRENGKLYYASEFSSRGDLWTMIRSKRRVGMETVKFLTTELILAVGHLHAHGIVHRDIKLENIMLDGNGHLKIIDLGLSKKLTLRKNNDEIKKYGFTFSMCGTSYYMPQEMIKSTGHNLTVDWWQVGCFIYELFVGRPAFYEKNQAKIHQRILSGEGPDYSVLKQHIGKHQDQEKVVNLIQSLLVNSPSDRLGYLGVEQVQKHSFFDDIDWDIVEKRQLPLSTELHEYVFDQIDSENVSSVFDRKLIATYFKDAKTLRGVPLNTAGKESLSESQIERIQAHQRSSASSKISSTTTTSSASSVSTKTTKTTASTIPLKVPQKPKRQDSIGPYLGFEYQASHETMTDIHRVNIVKIV